ncbi:hypothetical protein Acr_17g0007580 [Actinidia rufa]|uniref:Uncharacterized protein n=1 Tax=Actinidia rufa TaxID=165716 RepID=A0A7J0G322_9ERIC|nr:hypothetical protein Acr_17g0007580 [Actinidia rufa]
MKEEFGVLVSYHQAWMAVEKARENVFGNYALSFEDLRWEGIKVACFLLVEKMGIKSMNVQYKNYLIGLFNRCAYAPNLKTFEELIRKLKRDGCEAVKDFFSDLPCEHWTRVHFKGKRYGEMSSNLAECFNSWIKDERHLPIMVLVDKIRVQLFEQRYCRREDTSRWSHVICPFMDAKLVDAYNSCRTWGVIRSSDDLFEVQSHPSVFVDIGGRTCSCGKWQLNFPYVNAVCVLEKTSRPWTCMLIHITMLAVILTYSMSIYPVPTLWRAEAVASEESIRPPLSKRPSGRHKTQTIPSSGEEIKKITCGRCGQIGSHNRKTCKVLIQL